MDLVCLSCGESWELDYMLDEEPGDFTLLGPVVVRCPECTREVDPVDVQKAMQRAREVLAGETEKSVTAMNKNCELSQLAPEEMVREAYKREGVVSVLEYLANTLVELSRNIVYDEYNRREFERQAELVLKAKQKIHGK